MPAILPTSRADLVGKLALLEGLVDEVQIDVVDGVFAAPPTWPYTDEAATFSADVLEGDAIPFLGRFRFEIDLMVKQVEQVTGVWIAAGAQRLVLHAESTAQLPLALLDIQQKYGHAKGFAPGLLSVGLSVGNDTPLEIIEPFVDHIDFVQFMGIRNIGHQGEPFDERVLDRVRRFRKQYPNLVIQVDGAVSTTTAPHLLDAGVDRLVIGSDLWKAPNLKERLQTYQAMVSEAGLYA